MKQQVSIENSKVYFKNIRDLFDPTFKKLVEKNNDYSKFIY